MAEPITTDEVLARRDGELRDRLLRSGSLTNSEIASLRGVRVASARSFVARERRRHRLFTVRHGRNVIVPRILIDDDGNPTAATQAVEVLQPLGLDGWELWSWIASPSGWLSGDTPTAVFSTNQPRALAAVRAYATELRSTTAADQPADL